MNCDDARGHLLAGDERPEVAEHVASCSRCGALAPTLRRGDMILSNESMWTSPADDLENQIVDMLVTDDAAGSDEPIPIVDHTPPPRLHAVHEPLPVSQPVPDLAPVATRSRMPNLWALLAVAAVLVTGFVIVNSAGAQPDWSVEVGAGPAAPDAGATVDGWREPGGTRLVVNARNLTTAPDGFFYELWLSDGPLHISGGTFTGTSDIELWVAVSRKDFPRIWITLEPIDEDESPSEEVVLDTR